ncbi:MAG: hypothetical protein JWP74_1029 [Marmoricola sp.]|nr:hypothetical protein [Marmoricola sp.]
MPAATPGARGFASYLKQFSPYGVSSTDTPPLSTGRTGLSTGQGSGLWISGGSQTASARSTEPDGRSGVPSPR